MEALHHPLYWPDGFPRTPPNKRVHMTGCRDFVTARNMAISEIHALGGYRLVMSCLVGAGSMRWGDPVVAMYFRLDWPGGARGSYVLPCDVYTKLSCNLMAIADRARSIRRELRSVPNPREYLGQWSTSPRDAQLADQEADDVTNPFGPPRPPPRGANPFTHGNARAGGSTYVPPGGHSRRSWMPGAGDFVAPPQAPRPGWWLALGLSARPSTLREAEKAYRRLVLEHHPDRNPGGNEERMRQLNEAIERAREEMRR